MRHPTGRVAADGDQFSGNSYGDFFGSNGSDIDTNRSMHAVEKMSRDTVLLERLENLDDLALGADHADIARTSLNRPAEYAHVVSVATGHDDDVRRLVGIQMLHGLIEVFCIDRPSGWEAFLGGEGAPVIGDNNVEACMGSRLGKIDGDMARAENIKYCWGQDGLHE